MGMLNAPLLNHALLSTGEEAGEIIIGLPLIKHKAEAPNLSFSHDQNASIKKAELSELTYTVSATTLIKKAKAKQ